MAASSGEDNPSLTPSAEFFEALADVQALLHRQSRRITLLERELAITQARLHIASVQQDQAEKRLIMQRWQLRHMARNNR